MKILHIINVLELGGAQSVLKHLIERWPFKDDKHQVISLLQRGAMLEAFNTRGIPVEYLNFSPGQFKPKEFFKLIQAIRKYQPNIIQTWLYHSDLLGSLASRFTHREPVIWGVHHTTDSSSSVKSSTWSIVRMLILLSRYIPSKIVCCSASAYQSHLALGYPKDKMIRINNGVDTKVFQPNPDAKRDLRKELGISSASKIIGMFARYNPQKDHRTFIKAAALLSKNVSEVHFILAGTDVDQSNAALMFEIEKAGIQNQVHLLGARADMPYLHAGVDILSLSSSYGEALPMSLCEGMSCGTPCVATNIGDTENILGNTGLIVEPQNPNALAHAWEDILKLPEKEYQQLSTNARQRMIENFNLADMIHQYHQVYKEATSQA